MIRLFLTDLDGSLTDGTYFMFSNQEGIAKRFNTRDFHGIMLLQKAYDVRVMIITLASGAVVQNQVDRLKGLMDIGLMTKVESKYEAIANTYVHTGQYSWDEIAFIGDDVNDIGLLEAVGFAACPVDAEPEVRKVIENHPNGYICERGGGEGCVREFCDLIRRCNV